MLKINSLAPNFSLPDQNNKIHTLSDYLGQWVVVYFYPKDDTPGCTTQACSFRDQITKQQPDSTVVIGISKDTVRSHKKFADKFDLNFILLSDTTKETITSYHAIGTKKFMGREFQGVLRNTYIVDPKGYLVKIYENVIPKDHANLIFTDLKNLITQKSGILNPNYE